MSTILKKQIKQELLDQKQKELEQKQKVFSSLKKINLYCSDKNPMCGNYSKFLEENKIEFDKKDFDLSIASILGTWTQPAVSVNGVNLVVNRDFSNPQQLSQQLLTVANQDYVLPPFEVRIEEQLKNQFNALKQHITNLNRMISPIAKTLSSIQSEIDTEEKPNKGKNPYPKTKKSSSKPKE